MKLQKGFTLVELMIVIAIIGILAAIAIPVYMEYSIRARVVEGLGLTSVAKAAVAEVYSASGAFPTSNTLAGLPKSTSIVGNHVSSVGVGAGGVITITYRGSLGGTANNGTIQVSPASSAGSVTWSCTGGSMPGKYRPSNCR